MQGRMKVLVMVLVVAALLLAGGVALAAIPSGDGTIYACYKDQNGQLRVIDDEAGDTCLPSETPISWNQQGPAGPAGPPGVQGPQGDPGLSGVETVTNVVNGINFVGTTGAQASCPSGKRVIGGGAGVSPLSTSLVLQLSAPFPNDAGWNAHAANLGPFTSPWTLTVYAICANVAP
jgi:hypothetical protein